mmetsp:Transcript_124314/g.185757  ORF Transcript_124314/g.185757 Transcript_124314/m.185757 type:complete len:142 (-) Transcript_124314:399-824(-)
MEASVAAREAETTAARRAARDRKAGSRTHAAKHAERVAQTDVYVMQKVVGLDVFCESKVVVCLRAGIAARWAAANRLQKATAFNAWHTTMPPSSHTCLSQDQTRTPQWCWLALWFLAGSRAGAENPGGLGLTEYHGSADEE